MVCLLIFSLAGCRSCGKIFMYSLFRRATSFGLDYHSRAISFLIARPSWFLILSTISPNLVAQSIVSPRLYYITSQTLAFAAQCERAPLMPYSQDSSLTSILRPSTWYDHHTPTWSPIWPQIPRCRKRQANTTTTSRESFSATFSTTTSSLTP
jgi:hypothetical protein